MVATLAFGWEAFWFIRSRRPNVKGRVSEYVTRRQDIKSEPETRTPLANYTFRITAENRGTTTQFVEAIGLRDANGPSVFYSSEPDDRALPPDDTRLRTFP